MQETCQFVEKKVLELVLTTFVKKMAYGIVFPSNLYSSFISAQKPYPFCNICREKKKKVTFEIEYSDFSFFLCRESLEYI